MLDAKIQMPCKLDMFKARSQWDFLTFLCICACVFHDQCSLVPAK